MAALAISPRPSSFHSYSSHSTSRPRSPSPANSFGAPATTTTSRPAPIARAPSATTTTAQRSSVASNSSHLSDITDNHNLLGAASRAASAASTATPSSSSSSSPSINEMKSSMSSRELAGPSTGHRVKPGRENPALRRSSSEQTFEHSPTQGGGLHRVRSPHASLDSRSSRPQVQPPYNPYTALHAQQHQQQQHHAMSSQPQPWATMPVPVNAFYPYSAEAFQQAAWSAWQHQAMMNMHANGFVPQPPQAVASPPPSFLQNHLPSSNSSTASAASFPSANDNSSAATTQSNASANGRKNFHPYRREPSRSSSRESPRQNSNAPLLAFPAAAAAASTTEGVASTVGDVDDDDEQLRAPVRPFVKAKRADSLPENAGSVPQQRPRQDSGDRDSLKEEQPTEATVTSAVRAVVAPAIPVTSAAEPGEMPDLAPRIAPGHHRQTSSTSSMGAAIPSTLGQGSMLGEISRAPKQPPAAAPSPARLPSHHLSSDLPTPRSVSDQPKASEKKATGLKGRLQRALKKDESKAVPSTAPAATAAPRPPPASSDAIRDYPSAPAANGGLGARRPSNASFAPSMTEPVGGNSGKAKRSLFGMKNASTDNISISSTVSSASMMIRKMGALGKLARRNSIAGISKIFKDKAKDDDDLPPSGGEPKKKEKKLRFGKSSPSVSSTSHATAETLDEDKPIAGLSPAAQLARQHTLRQRAEEQQAQAAASQEEMQSAQREQQQFEDFSDADSVDQFADEFGEVSLDQRSVDTEDTHYEEGHWGQSYRDRHAVPARGILKKATSFTAEPPTAPWSRARSNSTELAVASPGPLDKVSKATNVDLDPFSPSFSPFDSTLDREPLADRLNFPYGHPSMNTSAPVLSLQPDRIKAHRSATTPAKKALNWAPECAIYHTFHATEYDRRSEPATCNRLTPQIAQQIKDELNGYKMEEMPVHPSSRINTHFFV